MQRLRLTTEYGHRASSSLRCPLRDLRLVVYRGRGSIAALATLSSRSYRDTLCDSYKLCIVHTIHNKLLIYCSTRNHIITFE